LYLTFSNAEFKAADYNIIVTINKNVVLKSDFTRSYQTPLNTDSPDGATTKTIQTFKAQDFSTTVKSLFF
jgi:hypothetical protein